MSELLQVSVCDGMSTEATWKFHVAKNMRHPSSLVRTGFHLRPAKATKSINTLLVNLGDTGEIMDLSRMTTLVESACANSANPACTFHILWSQAIVPFQRGVQLQLSSQALLQLGCQQK